MSPQNSEQRMAARNSSERASQTPAEQQLPKKVTPHEPGFQSVMGDRPYQFEGEVLKIDGEHFTIRRNDTSERVRLIVNQNTNLNCAGAPASRGTSSDAITSDRLTSERQAPKASEEQMAQGQRKDETARGAGFRIGQCDFQQGDRVKAEVDDKGQATTLTYIDRSSQ